MTCVLVSLLEHQLGVKSPQLPVSKADPEPRILPRCGHHVASMEVWAKPGPSNWQPSAWEGPGF